MVKHFGRWLNEIKQKEHFAEEFYRKVYDKVDFVEMISVEEV